MKFNTTEIAYSKDSLNVDSDKGIINKVLLARTGKVKGHGIYADETFTSQIVEQGNEFSQGMKARFGHPNMSSTTLGTYIGRWKNFSTENGNAYADLHLDPITKKTQLDGKGISMWEYTTEMATSNPDMFGNSIVFRPGKSETLRSEIKNEEVDRAYDEIVEVKEKTTIVDRRYARIKSLTASDLVDSPAATESLFDQFSTDEDFAYHASSFLNDNPKIFKLLDEHPDIYDSFMSKYKEHKSKINMETETKNLSSEDMTFFDKMAKKLGYGKEKDSEGKPDADDKVSKEVKELSDKVSELTANLSETKEKNTELSGKIEENETAFNELKTKYDKSQEKLGKLEADGSGATPKTDPEMDSTKLSERDKKMNNVAKDMKENS